MQLLSSNVISTRKVLSGNVISALCISITKK